MANNAVLGGHVSVGDNSFLGGQAAVRQFVRIGEGAMIVGLSGDRADIIPYGYGARPAREPGRPQCGRACGGAASPRPTSIACARRIRSCSLARACSATGSRRSKKRFAGVPLVESVLAFIRGGKRPLSTAIRRERRRDSDE